VSINLTDAAKYYQELPHQVEAWNWLQQTLSPEDLSVFADKYREAPKEETPQAQSFNPWSPFNYKITPHVTYGELTLSQESRRFTKQYQCDAALEICRFLEKARAAFGNKPIIITSGYRPPAINQSVGGAKTSEHLYSAPDVGAVDFYLEGIDIYQLQDWCDRTWLYSLGYGADRGFVHLGMREGKPRVRWNY